MINIFTEENEQTVYLICKWLESKSEDYNLIFPDSIDFNVFVSKKKKAFAKGLTWSDFGSDLFWYRRGALNLIAGLVENSDLDQLEKSHAIIEYDTLEYYLNWLIKSGRNFGTFGNAELNRLQTFDIAMDNKLQTPNYIVTNSKSDVWDFMRIHQKIIVKSIANGMFELHGSHLYTTLTKLFSQNDFKKLPDKFFPSLFVEYINKDFEIRIFYLAGSFYSCAIMSQANKRTKLDFRNYDLENPNRYAPYKIPRFLETKLKKIINYFQLKTCSIDMIVRDTGEYIFLEINPVGQFTFIGHPCNYYLEKELTDQLIISKFIR